MTLYNCPRCDSRSTPAHCPSCGRGEEPLLARLSELDAALAVLAPSLQSRRAVETERHAVLADLGRLAARYHAEATPPAGTAAPAPQAATPVAAGALPPPPPRARPVAGPAPVSGPTPAPPRGEVTAKTLQTVLLSLGGLLVAAAVIIFTAVAWRHLGDGGRLAVLGGFTAAMLAAPVALRRFRLRATAETFAALAALALWCSALAGYYLYLPDGGTLTARSVSGWTLVVILVLIGYRAAVRTAATGWALLPLAAVGAAFGAAGTLAASAALMFGTAAALGAAAWVVARRPGDFTRSDLWASRLLLCGAVIAGFLAGLRIAFGLSDLLVPIVAAAVAVLAAANLLVALYTRRSGASVPMTLVVSAAAGSLVVAAWVLAFRSGEPALALPGLALLLALFFIMTTSAMRETDRVESAATSAALAGALGLAAFAIVAFDAPGLIAHLVAGIAAYALAAPLPNPLRQALRQAAYVTGAGLAVLTAAITTEVFGMVWWDAAAPGALGWQAPTVLIVLLAAVPLLPKRFRFEAVAFAATFAILGATGLAWTHGAWGQELAPTIGFGLATAVAAATAIGAGTLGGRCAGWSVLALWLPITAAAVVNGPGADAEPLLIGFGLMAAAAAMLVTAAGMPRRTRPDRVLGAILAHVLAGTTGTLMLVAGWTSAALDGMGAGIDPLIAAAISAYALALGGVALLAPVKRVPYGFAAFGTAVLAYWSLLWSFRVDLLEYFTGPPAAALFAIGVWWLARRPGLGSWAALAPAVLLGLAPSLLLVLSQEGGGARRIGVGAAAVALVVASALRRWQAPLVVGAAVLAVLTLHELALLWSVIPKWIPLAIGGAVLIGAGATLEQRRRDLARLSRTVKAMR